MNRPELFVKSVDILVHAFQNGELKNMSPCNCAVGNLISYRTGIYDSDASNWASIIHTVRKVYRDNFSLTLRDIHRGFRKEINLTEYSAKELELIERSFEKLDDRGYYVSQAKTDATMESMHKVIDTLGKIHEIPEETVQCMQEHVKNNTYKFSYKFDKKDFLKIDDILADGRRPQKCRIAPTIES
jgi:hypothetical protein